MFHAKPSSSPGQDKRRVGLFSVFAGTKMIGAAFVLPVSRRARLVMGLGGVALVGHGAFQWLSGKHTEAQAEEATAGSSREVKASRAKNDPDI